LQVLVGDLNHLYQNEAALHQYDFQHQGFQWLECNDVEHSTLAFMRCADDPEDHVIVVLNFTPVPRYGFRVGVPLAGEYSEVLNSDSTYYAGSNCGNAGMLPTEHHSCMGLEYSVVLTIPPLGGLILKRL
jgi:1,4-alpha-glucan branching enzyme